MNPVLQESTSELIDYILQNINTILFLPEDYIMKQGEEFELQDKGDDKVETKCLYFLSKGE
jgi:hypothetical protein